MINRHPGQKRGADVKADVSVIVNDVFNEAAFNIKNPGESVGTVAFVINPVIPIGKGLGAGLVIITAGPGIFPWWLIKMSMNNQCGRHKSPSGKTHTQKVRPL